jgi:hypothetical protein
MRGRLRRLDAALYGRTRQTVDANGAIRLTHVPTFTLATATALLTAIRAESKKGGE